MLRIAKTSGGYWEIEPGFGPRKYARSPEHTVPWLINLLGLRPPVAQSTQVKYEPIGVVDQGERAYVVVKVSVERQQETLSEFRAVEMVRVDERWYVSTAPAVASAVMVHDLYMDLGD